MTHKRTTIRNALTLALTGLATCGARVYPSRIKPLTATDLPAILVSTGGEDEADAIAMYGNKPAIRNLIARLDIMVKAATGYEDTADTILAEIEAVLFDTPPHNTLSGVVHSVSLASIADPEMDDSSDKPVVRLPVILRVAYST